jgi:hypothetical protein
VPTTNRSYTALAQVEEVSNSGTLRGQMNARELRSALRALTGLVYLLAQHIDDNDSVKTDAMAQAHALSEAMVYAMEAS